mmetsp:Transcript_8064/g.17425  ORF Transcript_8064/g.17425 Transcript_8064/m.17425 type:complete len:518 (+) Transcript_8064:32-1585(+)
MHVDAQEGVCRDSPANHRKVMSSLDAAVINVGAAVAVRQVEHVHQLSRESRLSSDASTISLAFSNDPKLWVKTANAKVFPEKDYGEKKATVYRIRFNVETKKSGKRSKRYCHGKRYATKALAEADMFEVRSGKETLKNRKKLSEVKTSGALLDPAPLKRSNTGPNDSRAKKQKTTMRYDHAARSRSLPNRNPSGQGDICSIDILSVISAGGLVAWREAATRHRWRMKNPVRPWLDKNIRCAHMAILDKAIQDKTKWYMLMPFGEDEEVRADATEKDKEKLIAQAKILWTALDLYGKRNDGDTDTAATSVGSTDLSWRKACADASSQLRERYSGQVVGRWYVKFRCNDEMPLRFPLSRTGKAGYGAICPFSLPKLAEKSNSDKFFVSSEEEAEEAAAAAEALSGHDYRDVIIEFQEWFDANVQIMSVDKARIWYENKVKDISAGNPDFLTRYRIKSIAPLSKYVAKCWMRDMGIEYNRTAKNYYIKRHESDKALKQRGVYIPWSFESEVRELCWIQMS